MFFKEKGHSKAYLFLNAVKKRRRGFEGGQREAEVAAETAAPVHRAAEAGAAGGAPMDAGGRTAHGHQCVGELIELLF